MLSKLDRPLRHSVDRIVNELEKQTLNEALHCSAVLKGALRTLDTGLQPSRNVTIRKAFEQYANIRRCVSLNPIAPGAADTDILFVRENVEDLYASIEHRLGRNYPQAIRHLTTEGCELICRTAFEAALRDGRKKVTGLEKPNILKITGGLFKDIFMRVAQEYKIHKIDAEFMIIDDGLAAIAASPQRFDVVVTTNMFGDIGSDVAAKVTSGIGFVSSNNINYFNPKSVSMFETMGGTADDIAGLNKANPVALIDASAEMLLHIGGHDNILAAELIKSGILHVLSQGYYVGDIKRGPYQINKNKPPIGTQEFATLISNSIQDLREKKHKQPSKSIKQLMLETASADVAPLYDRFLRSYEIYSQRMNPKHQDNKTFGWYGFVNRTVPPNPIRSTSKIVGFDMFVDNHGMKLAFNEDGSINEHESCVDPEVQNAFKDATNVDINTCFNQGTAGSIQSIRSFSQYIVNHLRTYINNFPDEINSNFQDVIQNKLQLSSNISKRFSSWIQKQTLQVAFEHLQLFEKNSSKLIQSFYSVQAQIVEPILQKHGFILVRITSRGTEIYPTFCDFEKREVDRFRIQIDPNGMLADCNDLSVALAEMCNVMNIMAKKGWIISEFMLNRTFVDCEGDNKGKEISGVSVPYAQGLGVKYC